MCLRHSKCCAIEPSCNSGGRTTSHPDYGCLCVHRCTQALRAAAVNVTKKPHCIDECLIAMLLTMLGGC